MPQDPLADRQLFDGRRHCAATNDWWCDVGDRCSDGCIVRRRAEAHAAYPDGGLKLREVRPHFYREHDNVDTFEALVGPKPRKRWTNLIDQKTAIYEERRSLYLARRGPLVKFFKSDGKPCGGFGGAEFSITMADGSARSFKGGWSSDEISASLVFPEHRCVPCAVTTQPDDWERGYTFSHYGLVLDALLDWWFSRNGKVTWGLAVIETDHGPHIIPTDGRYVKMTSYRQRWTGRLTPWPGKGLDPQYHAAHRGAFMRAVEKAFGPLEATHAPGDLAGEQNHAIRA